MRWAVSAGPQALRTIGSGPVSRPRTVEAVGLEPTTPCLQSPRLGYARTRIPAVQGVAEHWNAPFAYPTAVLFWGLFGPRGLCRFEGPFDAIAMRGTRHGRLACELFDGGDDALDRRVHTHGEGGLHTRLAGGEDGGGIERGVRSGRTGRLASPSCRSSLPRADPAPQGMDEL
jgi:hypothetical protein